MYKVEKSWLKVGKKTISETEEKEISMSDEIKWDNDHNAENVSMCFNFIESCLNFQGHCDNLQKEQKHLVVNTETGAKKMIEGEFKMEDSDFNF